MWRATAVSARATTLAVQSCEKSTKSSRQQGHLCETSLFPVNPGFVRSQTDATRLASAAVQTSIVRLHILIGLVQCAESHRIGFNG